MEKSGGSLIFAPGGIDRSGPDQLPGGHWLASSFEAALQAARDGQIRVRPTGRPHGRPGGYDDAAPVVGGRRDASGGP